MIGEILTAALIVVTASLVIVGIIGLVGGMTRIKVQVAQETFYRQLSGDPYRAIRVRVINRSAHSVYLRTMSLQLLRLLPFPSWQTLSMRNPIFLGEIVAHSDDETALKWMNCLVT